VAKGGRIQGTITVFGKEVRYQCGILVQKSEVIFRKLLAWKYSIVRKVQLK
jgi:hypothetical protein